MNELIQRYWRQGLTYWGALSRIQQALALAAGGSVVAALFVAGLWASRPNYGTLFANLNSEDSAAIQEQLKALKVPYRVEGAGQLLVPASQVHELRLKIAGQGLPSGGGVGFEVFDKTSFGITDFTQRLNYQRALQGELSRTIGQLRAVSQARVHLALPQPTLFSDREKPATASVVLRLKPGASLTNQEVRGVVHLVASSVEGLSADKITVVDTNGRILSQGGERSASQLSAQQIETQAMVAADLERRVTTMLESVLGPGKATVRVAAKLSFDQVERTEERFDPNTVVRQEQRTTESSSGVTTAPIGTPGVAANVTTPQGGTSTINNKTGRETEVVNYEVGKTVERKVIAPGEIVRLSVAVLIDSPSRQGGTGAEAESQEPAGRSQEEMDKIRRLVVSAVGFNAARGDDVQVVELPYDTSAAERERAESERARHESQAYQRNVWVGAAVAVVAMLLLIVVFRALRRRRLATVLSEAGYSPGPAVSIEAARAAVDETHTQEMLELEGKRKEELRQKALAFAYQKPEEVAQLLRAWMLKRKASTT